MSRARRILAITAGLSLLGAIAGAIAGAVVATLVVLIMKAPRSVLDTGVAQIGAILGAPLGAVLLPLSAWLTMRRVSFGRAALGTAIGTIVGGTFGWFAPLGGDELVRSLIGALLGFALAVLVLRRTALPAGSV